MLNSIKRFFAYLVSVVVGLFTGKSKKDIVLPCLSKPFTRQVEYLNTEKYGNYQEGFYYWITTARHSDGQYNVQWVWSKEDDQSVLCSAGYAEAVNSGTGDHSYKKNKIYSESISKEKLSEILNVLLLEADLLDKDDPKK